MMRQHNSNRTQRKEEESHAAASRKLAQDFKRLGLVASAAGRLHTIKVDGRRPPPGLATSSTGFSV
jgi:hypothetical protein